MLLKEISPLCCNSTLCCGGRYVYKNRKDTVPYGYCLKTLTTAPYSYLWVQLPITPALKTKFGELKKRCLASPVHLVEVSFTNLNIIPDINSGSPITRYRATATDFQMED